MMDAKYSKRQIVAARRLHQIEEEKKRLREFVADLPFNKIILLQEVLENQHKDIHSKQFQNPKKQAPRRLTEKRIINGSD